MSEKKRITVVKSLDSDSSSVDQSKTADRGMYGRDGIRIVASRGAVVDNKVPVTLTLELMSGGNPLPFHGNGSSGIVEEIMVDLSVDGLLSLSRTMSLYSAALQLLFGFSLGDIKNVVNRLSGVLADDMNVYLDDLDLVSVDPQIAFNFIPSNKQLGEASLIEWIPGQSVGVLGGQLYCNRRLRDMLYALSDQLKLTGLDIEDPYGIM